MAHTPCPGLGVGFLRRAVGVRLRPLEGRDFGNEAGAGGCASQALLVSVEPKMPVSSEGGKRGNPYSGLGVLSLLGSSEPARPASSYALTLGEQVSGSTCSLVRGSEPVLNLQAILCALLQLPQARRSGRQGSGERIIIPLGES